jgi:hypothetical protein
MTSSPTRMIASAAPNKIQFNGVGGLRTYISFAYRRSTVTFDRGFEGVLGMKKLSFLAGNKSIAGAVFIRERLTMR